MSRQEKVILKPAKPLLYTGCGGTLLLTDGKLVWKRSRWGLLQYGFSKGIRAGMDQPPPESFELDLTTAAELAPGGRKIAWIACASLVLALIEIVSGGMRKTLMVHAPFGSPPGKYFFTVRDVTSWLEDIENVRVAVEAGSRQSSLD
jgi:hypothetical protein